MSGGKNTRAWEADEILPRPLAGQISMQYLWSCATHVVECYTHGTVLHTWYCTTPMIQCYIHGTVLHTWYYTMHMVLHYAHGTALHT